MLIFEARRVVPGDTGSKLVFSEIGKIWGAPPGTTGRRHGSARKISSAPLRR
jgi:hypothetical protein